MKLSIYYSKTVLLFVFWGSVQTVHANIYTSDFETIGGSLASSAGATEFAIGPASFTGGISGVAGVFELYHSGSQAWMVRGGGTGVIAFEPGQYEVEFFAKANSLSTGTTEIRAYGLDEDVLATAILNAGDPFTQFSVSGFLGRIELINNDTNNTRFNALDDITITAVPLPGAFWLFGFLSFGLFALRNRDEQINRKEVQN